MARGFATTRGSEILRQLVSTVVSAFFFAMVASFVIGDRFG